MTGNERYSNTFLSQQKQTAVSQASNLLTPVTEPPCHCQMPRRTYHTPYLSIIIKSIRCPEHLMMIAQTKTIPPSLRLATLPGLAASRRLWNDFHPATLCQCQPTTAKHVSNHPSTDTSPVRRDIGQKLVAVTWTSRNLQDDEWQTLTNTQNSQKSQCFTCDIGVRAGHNINQFKLN